MLAPSISDPTALAGIPAPPAVVPPAAVSNGSPRRRTLLIVDDEEGPRQSLRIVFKGEYDLLLASDGLGAVDRSGK